MTLSEESPRGAEPAAEAGRNAELYRVLHDLAARAMRRERAGHTLQPTALIHETWLRLAREDREAWPKSAAFYAACARTMRQVLIDHARRCQALRRGGDRGRVAIAAADTIAANGTDPADEEVDVLELEDALSKLAGPYPRAARVVELRFFAGLSVDEIAAVIGVSPRTVDSDWALARASLIRSLDGDAR